MVPDVVGPGEAAELLGVSRQRFNVLAKRPEFPPAAKLSVGNIYDGPLMRAYASDRITRSLKHQRCLLHYRETGSIGRAANYAPCNYKTAKKWLEEWGALAGRTDVALKATLK